MNKVIAKKIWEKPTHERYGDVEEITKSKWLTVADGFAFGPDDAHKPPVSPGAP
ncbi:MAG: hypothetical protein GY702_28740 [Desulfobulbaceae bacterium]|nr:hypothetical protein [Desulfobulbaceae bacterium]